MKNYRAAFYVAVAACVVLLAFGAWAWSARPDDSGAASRTVSANATATTSATDAGAPAAPAPSEPSLAPVQLSPERLQRIGVSIGEVVHKAVEDHIATTGNVAVDESRVAYVQVRFSGYIQRVFVNSTYQYVRRGEPLFTIYSPDLVATEREYLLARANRHALARTADPEVAHDADALVEAASARLKQWSVPPREIARLKSSGRVLQDLTIDSPVSGYVTEREALPNKFAQPDTRLYTVADLSTIWVLAQVYQNDLGRLKAGDPATLTVDTYPGRTFSGRVDFIYPDVDMTTRTARVRLVFANPGLKLMPGMYVNVSLSIPMGERLVIPASGVLATGTRQIVFVDRGGGSLEPRVVELGARMGGDYVVLKGLTAGERIVTSANFLIDSESQLQAALGSFTAPAPGSGTTAALKTSQASLELTTDPTPAQRGKNRLRVKLTGRRDAPISGAQVSATFFMPAMPAMGMGAMRRSADLTERGAGVYEGSLELPGGGAWQVTVIAKKDGQILASKQLAVDVAGGM